MPTDQQLLDAAKQRYLQAKQDVEGLRTKIAQAACPLKVGDRVTVVDGAKEYEGVVDYVSFALKDEVADPVVGAATGWSVGGQRMLKGTDQTSKWSFHFTSWNAQLVQGKWVLEERSLEKILGLR